MTQQNLIKIMSWVLKLGIFLSVFFVLFGAICYLWQEGSKPFIEMKFSPTAFNFSLSLLWRDLLPLSSRGLIELGLLFLATTQIVRLAAILIYFLSLKEMIFSILSLFIFILLTAALFIPIS